MELVKKTNINFMGHRKVAYTLSFLLVVIALVSMFSVGLNYGVDFAGGLLLQYSFQQPVTVDEIRATLTEIGLGESIIQSFAEDEVVVRTSLLPEEERAAMRTALEESFGPVNVVRIEEVGPAIGADLRRMGVFALLLAIGGILVYVSLRFEFRPAVTSIIALAHDGFVVLGILTLLQREFSIPVLAAVLTILGYSINDSIVIMDRVRENFSLHRRTSITDLLNKSLNETFSRTVNTTLTTLLPVLALLFFGGRMLQDFSLTMFIGLLVGTYSTIFITGAILVDWEKRKPLRR